ncbi:hypothetical protein TNCV_2495141 [Trichonephila clavipes]|nr:hypothetical protein TNCV_2495141 [Trichonephila clavipes]
MIRHVTGISVFAMTIDRQLSKAALPQKASVSHAIALTVLGCCTPQGAFAVVLDAFGTESRRLEYNCFKKGILLRIKPR